MPSSEYSVLSVFFRANSMDPKPNDYDIDPDPWLVDDDVQLELNNPDVEFDRTLVDGESQATSSIIGGELYAAQIDTSASGWNSFTSLSVEDTDPEDYGDALVIEDYGLPYADVSYSETLESIGHREDITTVNQSFDTVSEADLTAQGSSSPIRFESAHPRRSRGSSVSSESEGASTPRPARQQKVAKWHIVDHVRASREGWLKDPKVISICRIIREKVDLMPKPWQIDVMINTIYEKKDIVVSAGTGSGKSLPYTLISLIKPSAIVLVLSPTIALMTDQVRDIVDTTASYYS